MRRGRGGRLPFPNSALSVATALSALSACTPAPNGPSERIVVPHGASLSQVADSLEAHGVVTARRWFKLLGRIRGVDREVHSGVYEFTRGTGWWEILSVLAEGRVASMRFTVPEGLTVLDLAQLAEDQLRIPTESVIVAAGDRAIAESLGLAHGGLEGFLLPDTYQVPVGVSARELVQTMGAEFQHRWLPAWDRRLDSLGLTRTQLVALASIIEGEARHDEDRPLIAGVYHNRLRLGMALQADPTVQYAIELKTGERKPRLVFKDYEIRSPYNTYLHPGLPPGPVNSPGLKCILAALYPAQVPYLYFVAGPDGYHIFSRTIADHDAAVAKVRRIERAEKREREKTDGR